MIAHIVASGLFAVVFYSLWKHSQFKLARRSLSKIRGPKSTSFIFGNLLELFQRPVGQTDFEWQNIYGDIVRFKTVFGESLIDHQCYEDELFVTDPKALQTMLNKSAYNYPKQHNLRVISRMINGQGIIWADGDDHKRQRKILLPGFGGPESKAFLTIFRGCAESMCMKWAEMIGTSSEQRVVLDVTTWLSRATLDAIGLAAFDVQFGAIQDSEHPLVMKYNNFIHDMFGHPSAQQIFIQAASKYIPSLILQWIGDHASSTRLERVRDLKRSTARVAKKLIQEKAESLLAGKGCRDVFSLLIKANMDSDAREKLTEEELLSQMRTIMFAGHETTSNSLSWIFLELARHPEIQSRVRAEIKETKAAIRARGDTQFSVADFDAMPYTVAVIKEGLRYHPVAPHIHRIAAKEDVLPLSRPITTESGETISEILVPKGTLILVSIAAYNRNKELWGDDAHEFNPDRWLIGVAGAKKSVSVGVYSNLMTFLGGTRACLGWRFAVIEIQAFLVETLGKFEFTMTDRSERVCRGPSSMMIPTVRGELEYGSQLPLAVSIACNEVADSPH